MLQKPRRSKLRINPTELWESAGYAETHLRRGHVRCGHSRRRQELLQGRADTCPCARSHRQPPGFPERDAPSRALSGRQHPSARQLRGAANGHLGKELGHQPSQPSKFTVIKHGILAKTARLHGRKKVPGSPRQRRPLPSRSHVAVWPHTRTTPARASCHRSQGHSFATAAPSGGGGRGNRGSRCHFTGRGDRRRAEQPPARCTRRPAGSAASGHLPTRAGPRGAAATPALLTLPSSAPWNLTHWGPGLTTGTGQHARPTPAERKAPDWLHRTVDLAKRQHLECVTMTTVLPRNMITIY